MIYDTQYGHLFVEMGSSDKVCKREKESKIMDCFVVPGDGRQNINSITPLFGYNFKTYPFYLVRSNRLYIVDMKNYEIVEIWH